MFLKRITKLLCLLTIISLTACGKKDTQPDRSDNDKIKVSVSFNAMKEFAEAVGKDKVEITTIIPDGMEPHDFEPKARDMTALSDAGVFIYNGLGLEAWAEEAVAAAKNGDLVVVEASKGAEAIEAGEGEDPRESSTQEGNDAQIEDSDPGEDDDHGQYDPHIWLSLKGAEQAVKNIRDGLILADPANEEYYQQNCEDYVSELEELFREYDEKFKSVRKNSGQAGSFVKNNSFVTGHAAFGYLCRDFGLVQNSVEDVFAEGEPSAQQLAELVEYCRTNDITVIFAEEMASPEVSRALADEVGAQVETVYTIESNEDDKTYLERMEENLSKIYDSINK